ncbi:integral membrane protein, YjbE family [Hoeflea sp. IMCC20628]|uniref:YjbE family putative metal transport protein n=1 Tax=Hoeflea sp. IMCC20628 TaxID=1620421 RepID=UPI00063AEE2D|nr:YjbE family putative metal transport protein [Hoeflea sp. IMCC20628]AKI02854.1 integral membrane protein, YjbE family [Hoeflea sp. IMCC20628]
MLQLVLDFGTIVLADLVLSGDNALIIGMAAASLSPELRKRAILYGIIVAAVLRIIFALVATKLLGVPGLLFLGALLLFWVCWRLYGEIRANIDEDAVHALEAVDNGAEGCSGPSHKTLVQALISITIADLSMSIDNVLAVAAIADGNTQMLVFGLGLAILLMAFAATMIMKLLSHFPAISWLGLAVLIYVAGDMMYRGIIDPDTGILSMLHAASL